jgi:hypothetical protein
MITVGSIVKCADCYKEAKVIYVYDVDGKLAIELDCRDINAFCERCQLPARNVSDTGSEIYVFCDNCFDDSDLYDPPELMAISSQNNWRKTSKKPPLEEIRKVYPRAYDKWTEDEKIAVGLFINKVPHHKLSLLFNREPNAVKINRSIKSKVPITEINAIRFLGKTVQCNSCNHQFILTYRHLELVANKLSTRVLNLKITDVGSSSKCKECGLKDFKFTS